MVVDIFVNIAVCNALVFFVFCDAGADCNRFPFNVMVRNGVWFLSLDMGTQNRILYVFFFFLDLCFLVVMFRFCAENCFITHPFGLYLYMCI